MYLSLICPISGTCPHLSLACACWVLTLLTGLALRVFLPTSYCHTVPRQAQLTALPRVCERSIGTAISQRYLQKAHRHGHTRSVAKAKQYTPACPPLRKQSLAEWMRINDTETYAIVVVPSSMTSVLEPHRLVRCFSDRQNNDWVGGEVKGMVIVEVMYFFVYCAILVIFCFISSQHSL